MTQGMFFASAIALSDRAILHERCAELVLQDAHAPSSRIVRSENKASLSEITSQHPLKVQCTDIPYLPLDGGVVTPIEDQGTV